MSDFKVAWCSRGKSTEKVWGHEESWGTINGTVQGKVLHIRQGQGTSLKWYSWKCESFYVMSGAVEVLLGDELTVSDPVEHALVRRRLGPGECLYVQSCCPYQITALEHATIIEIGDAMSDVAVSPVDPSELLSHVRDWGMQ